MSWPRSAEVALSEGLVAAGDACGGRTRQGSASADSPAGPWQQALRRLRRDRTSLGACIVLLAILAACMAAPLYASHGCRGRTRSAQNLNGKIMIGGKRTSVMQPSTEGRGLGVTPIGPTWQGPYLLGADTQGRDVAPRLLYGGRNLLPDRQRRSGAVLDSGGAPRRHIREFWAAASTLVLSRILDVLWAFSSLSPRHLTLHRLDQQGDHHRPDHDRLREA